jgi:hypothetical protein
MESEDQKKKHYSHPTLTKLTAEQTRKVVADRKTCSKDEADDFFESLRKQPPNNTTNQKRKRSA